mmetsp:Transcript_11900/g.14157  ORF Transcript_11900/g.14157 Transcript_11900/m.14157 type:complete len:540 (+) Transcript_11900:314-1933(+)|eukprot:CAMPEP_0197851648 /NCGR_PEP_ID=MMETSP1438-20131217/18530_1 /TAXON_ID=1461541 /ORGANISM="Pterosperma sp., Strain CCMP1384" /LENGTH=539 /DNA_ID=CAMNT_0043465333 /DNA_START=277 /DNA_END=1896 /DNA_ORIENTATION=-
MAALGSLGGVRALLRDSNRSRKTQRVTSEKHAPRVHQHDRALGSSSNSLFTSKSFRSTTRRSSRHTKRSRHGNKIRAIIHTDDNEIIDYYQMFGLDKDKTITTKEIKKRYHSLAKECHPDVCDAENASEMCILLNEAYDTLIDDDQRKAYNYELQVQEEMMNEFSGFQEDETYSDWWCDDPEETRAVFVDEVMCIGCRNCVHAAGATFRIDGMQPKGREVNGKARVTAQWLNDEYEIQEAIDACPTDCISWVERDQLPILEHCMAMIADQGNMPASDMILLARAGSGFQIIAEDPYLFSERFAQKWAEFKRSLKKDVKLSVKVMNRVDAQSRLQAATGISTKSKRWKVFNSGSMSNRHTVPFDRALVPMSCYASYMAQYFASLGHVAPSRGSTMVTAALADPEMEVAYDVEDNLVDDVVCEVDSFEVTIIDASGRETKICCPEDQYILDAAEAEGLDLPYSCRAGTCPSCVAQIVGSDLDSVQQYDQTFVNEEMESKGYVLTCRAYATKDVTLRVAAEKELLTDLKAYRRAQRQARLQG